LFALLSKKLEPSTAHDDNFNSTIYYSSAFLGCEKPPSDQITEPWQRTQRRIKTVQGITTWTRNASKIKPELKSRTTITQTKKNFRDAKIG
jgi:hypothetical protein